jgi:hypothetical protein
MYPIVLAVLLSVAIASVYEHITSEFVRFGKLKFISNPPLIIGILSVAVAWYGDVSILGAYGFTGAQWIDVLGSGMVIATAAPVLEGFLDRLPK